MPTGIVTASVLNVRPLPSTAREPVGQVRRGEELEIVGREAGWYHIRRNGMEGYVHGDFVRIKEERPASGYLHERPDLQVAPLPAPESRRRPTSGLAGSRLAAAQTWNRYGGLVLPLCDNTGVEPAAAIAVLLVESSGSGFKDGRLVIRFENHVFRRQLGDADAAVFDLHFRYDPARPWQGHQFRADEGSAWVPCHTSQAREWEVFEAARALASAAALRSISMGLPQIMGFNAARIGYESPQEMFDRFSADERYHVLGLFDFIVGPGTTSAMLEDLRRGRFEQFATHYNGPGQASKYGARLRQYHDQFLSL
jgi:N-acetylmuramidase/Bacterial SH3 domain